ncbi:MAG: aminoacyl-tRNA hydrolase [Candidatus Pacebacteria bacterium]|nr:aminoacyl-tRNA hydrolase [Candidatus Paceibacterota bacterium]
MNFLLFPLGNFGDKYKYTRHNAGRFVFDKLKENKFLDEFLIKEKDFKLDIFIPNTFMNESGQSLKEFIKNRNIKTENIIIIYDDKDLEIGDIRLVKDRGDGGHNGIKSIIESLCTKNFYRIRVGIAPAGTGKDGIAPPHGEIVQKYVLGNLSEEEKNILSNKEVLEKASNFIFKILNGK